MDSKILIAEDEAAISWELRALLGQAGYQAVAVILPKPNEG